MVIQNVFNLQPIQRFEFFSFRLVDNLTYCRGYYAADENCSSQLIEVDQSLANAISFPMKCTIGVVQKHTNFEIVSGVMKLLVETCCFCQFCIWVKFSIAVPFPDKALHQCICVLQQHKNIFLYPEDIVGKYNIFMAMYSLLLCGCAAMLTGEVSRFDMSLTMALFHLHQ